MTCLTQGGLLTLAILFSTWASANERPNIIVMVADDLGWADVGYHGGPIDTPSLDRLAAEGVQLDRFYTTPICSPTRAALMTARDPIRLGVAYATIMPWMNNGIHPDEQFLPQSFLAAGYQTAMVGKWHLGHAQQDFHPNNRGFEHFYGHLHTEVGYFPPFSNQGGKDFQLNGQSITKDGYETFLLADEVSRYIRERDQTKPFFVYMPFIAPHTPLEAPADLMEKYADMVDDRKPARARNTDNTRRIRQLTMRPARARPTPPWWTPWIRPSDRYWQHWMTRASPTTRSCCFSATTAVPPMPLAAPTMCHCGAARAIHSKAVFGWSR